jgi:hypothetical protein
VEAALATIPLVHLAKQPLTLALHATEANIYKVVHVLVLAVRDIILLVHHVSLAQETVRLAI